jgi:hypothetical protein
MLSIFVSGSMGARICSIQVHVYKSQALARVCKSLIEIEIATVTLALYTRFLLTNMQNKDHCKHGEFQDHFHLLDGMHIR